MVTFAVTVPEGGTLNGAKLEHVPREPGAAPTSWLTRSRRMDAAAPLETRLICQGTLSSAYLGILEITSKRVSGEMKNTNSKQIAGVLFHACPPVFNLRWNLAQHRPFHQNTEIRSSPLFHHPSLMLRVGSGSNEQPNQREEPQHEQ